MTKLTSSLRSARPQKVAPPSQRERPRKVVDIMSAVVYTCRPTDTCGRAAQIMWDHDCGALPIVSARGQVVGMVTDRDICMAAYTQGKAVWEIPVTAASSLRVCFVRPGDPILYAIELMAAHRVRRLPVIDMGGNLVGVVSLADIVCNARGQERGDALDCDNIVECLAELCRPHESRNKVQSHVSMFFA